MSSRQENGTGLFSWLKGLLPRRAFKAVQMEPASMRFIGKLGGDVAKAELLFLQIVKTDPGLKRAYLTGVKYEGDPKTRLTLCIDTSTPPPQAFKLLAKSCAKIGAFADIVCFEDLKQTQIDSLKETVKPFYDADSSGYTQ